MDQQPASVSAPTGVLLCSLGTPAAPTAGAIRTFLREFLSDPRMVQTKLPRWGWKLILEGVILPFRPAKIAHKYKQIWTREGSPLFAISKRQAAALERQLDMPVELAMRYGEPSIENALLRLNERGCDQIVAFPLFPQSSETTTGSVFGAVNEILQSGKLKFELLTEIPNYFQDGLYIDALANSVEEHWEAHGRPEKLLISFHGLPLRYADSAGYRNQCETTAQLVVQRLGLKDSEWQICFQSRYGRGEWLQPYTFGILKQLGQSHVKRVDVISPGFAADCLETLHELAVEGRELFQLAGGGEYYYTGALNDRPDHITALAEMVNKAIRK